MNHSSFEASACKMARPGGAFSKSGEGSVCLDSDWERRKRQAGPGSKETCVPCYGPCSLQAVLRKHRTGEQSLANQQHYSRPVVGGEMGGSKIIQGIDKMVSQPSHGKPRKGQEGESEKCCFFSVVCAAQITLKLTGY